MNDNHFHVVIVDEEEKFEFTIEGTPTSPEILSCIEKHLALQLQLRAIRTQIMNQAMEAIEATKLTKL